MTDNATKSSYMLGLPSTSASLLASSDVKDKVQPLTKHKSLAQELVDALSDRIRDGRLKIGDKLPSEAAIEQQFGVSRTVVREAISRMQAAGLVVTRHGIGTFILDTDHSPTFKLTQEDFATLKDVIAVLELRIGIEVEAAALAAMRRTPKDLKEIERSLKAIQAAIDAGQDAVAADFQFHLNIVRASQNPHYADLMASLGPSIIPRARLEKRPLKPATTTNQESYLRKVNLEHESILNAIRNQDPESARAAMRTHLSNSKERRRDLMK